MNSLQIQDLSLTYRNGTQALQNISFEIYNGIFGLLGPNGAGKSSLMKTIVGLQKPSSGNIIFNGVDVVKSPLEIKKFLGFLPQDFGVYPKVSAYDLLDHLAILKGVVQKKTRKEQIMQLLEQVNLTAFKNKEVHTFSGGMKQRFGVAQALLGNPKIVIVDEPTAGLDPEERNRFNTMLSVLSEDMIVILSTHLVEDVRNLCSQMAIIKGGCLIASGTPKTMMKSLEGRLWGKKINPISLSDYTESQHIISQNLIERDLFITVLSSTCPEGFELVSPTLEHVYFANLNGSDL